MRGLLPGEVKSDLFCYISALPDSIHEVLSANDSELGVLVTRATPMIKEKAAKKKRSSQIKDSVVQRPLSSGQRSGNSRAGRQ